MRILAPTVTVKGRVLKDGSFRNVVEYPVLSAIFFVVKPGPDVIISDETLC